MKGFINAFTIVEAVVSMVVTAIIVGIIFLIFSITSERLLDFTRQNAGISDVNRFSYSVSKSVFEAEGMINDNGNLVFKSYDGNKTAYFFKENYVLRSQESFTDTFYMAKGSFRLDTLNDAKSTIIYQRLRCRFLINKADETYNFYRRLYADQILNSKYSK